MGVTYNRSMKTEERTILLLEKIANALGSISMSMASPQESRKATSWPDDIQKQLKEQRESQRREVEIEELKKQNKIAMRVMYISVVGLFLSAISSLLGNYIGYLQLENDTVQTRIQMLQLESTNPASKSADVKL